MEIARVDGNRDVFPRSPSKMLSGLSYFLLTQFFNLLDVSICRQHLIIVCCPMMMTDIGRYGLNHLADVTISLLGARIGFIPDTILGFMKG